jgi:hypothetical protein
MAWLIDQGPGHEAPSVPGNRQVHDRDHSHQAEGDGAEGSQTGQAVQRPIVARCQWLAPRADSGLHRAPGKRYERSTGEVPLFSSAIQPEALGSNPRSGSRPIAVFGTAAIGHQANPPPTTIALAAAAGTGATSPRGGRAVSGAGVARRRRASRPGLACPCPWHSVRDGCPQLPQQPQRAGSSSRLPLVGRARPCRVMSCLVGVIRPKVSRVFTYALKVFWEVRDAGVRGVGGAVGVPHLLRGDYLLTGVRSLPGHLARDTPLAR